MALRVTKVDVWAGEIVNQVGGLSRVLETLGNIGASLDCVIARRDKIGTGVVFLSPVRGKRVEQAARATGLSPANGIGTLRVEGTDRPGLGAKITRAVADAGISMRGTSAMVLGNRFVAYLGFDSEQDADTAAQALRSVNGRPSARRGATGGAKRKGGARSAGRTGARSGARSSARSGRRR